MNTRSLCSLHVLVTRPKQLAEELCRAIKKYGGKTTLFPTLEIAEPEDRSSLLNAIGSIDSFDFALFISPSAVLKTAEHINISELPLQIISLGSSTTKALEAKGCAVSIKPNGHDSEALLQLPQLQASQIKDKRLIIFKGEGGRNLITETLTERGAIIVNANMYRRSMPQHYTALTSDALQSIDVILISSAECLNNLVNMVDNKQTLYDKTILVPGNRCKNTAINLGFKSVIETQNATNAAFIDTLQDLATA